ncbi:lysin [Ligilactobacillus salitolerans]|uniref:Lysin n=1 Tax=Ligilactobacillus salitolerans TaxID=1808352 RepID=A0A401IST2_9LACO|nr:GH25 family lysozyme [Ligilactobacillus salitolerans]GBG94555.1 lysin [Ligilactobacillus salitolerans]
MSAKFIDVASYQPETLAYFQAAKALGITGVVVKITEGSAQGTNYVNPKAKKQVQNARKCGLTVSGYHFLRSISVSDAKQEAQFFVKEAQKVGLNKGSMLAIDVEAGDLTHQPAALTDQVNTFAAELKRLGYGKVSVYASTSWFKARLLRSKLLPQTLWVASYDTKDAGISCAAWQYTDRQLIAGAKTDVSVDYSGLFTGNGPEQVQKAVVKPAVKNTWVDDFGVTWHQEKGIFVSQQAIYLRWGASTKSSQIALLPAGSGIKYDAFAHSGGYVWLRQPRGKGQFGYLATGKSANGQRVDCWGKFI